MSFILSKVLWTFLSPGSAIVLLLLLGAFLSVAQRETWRAIGRRLCFVMALMLFLIAILPVGDWLLLPLEDRFAAAKPDHVDGIILVGEDESPELASVRGAASSSHFSTDDYMVFTALARQYPHAQLVYTGGSGLIAPDPDLSSAAVAKQALSSIGAPIDRMLFEEKSRTTHENATESTALVHPTKQQKWLLVTSAEHMPRTLACFRKEGWNVFPEPASYMTDGKFSIRLRFALAVHLLQMDLAVHEYIGLVAYRLQGYTSELWPK